MCISAPLSYSLITAKSFEFAKVSLIAAQILGLLVNTLVAYEKYPVLNGDNITIPIQIQLSQKQNTFSKFLPTSMKCRLNFKYFEKKDDPPRFYIFDITDSKNIV